MSHLQLEFDSEAQTLTVNGVHMAFAFLEALTHPDPATALRMHRVGDAVLVETYRVENVDRLREQLWRAAAWAAQQEGAAR